MEKFKHHNIFMCYTKYKSSWVILHKIKRIKIKLHKLFIPQNDPILPLSLLHRFLAFSPPKTGERLKIVLPISPSSVAGSQRHL